MKNSFSLSFFLPFLSSFFLRWFCNIIQTSSRLKIPLPQLHKCEDRCEHHSQLKRENVEIEMRVYKIRTSLVGVKQRVIKYCLSSEKSVNLEKLIESLENKSEEKR